MYPIDRLLPGGESTRQSAGRSASQSAGRSGGRP
jgi:hypothetical protein